MLKQLIGEYKMKFGLNLFCPREMYLSELFKSCRSTSEDWKFHKSGQFWVHPPLDVLWNTELLCSDSAHHEQEHETAKKQR